MRILLFLLISVQMWAVGFLQPDEAFKPSAKMVDGKTIGVEIIMGDQIHIYADKLKVEDADKKDGIDFKSVTMVEPIVLDGEKVYESSPAIRIALFRTKELTGEKKVKIKLSYQGCSSAGLCYEPMEKTLEVSLDASKVPMSESSVLKAPAVEQKSIDIAPPPVAKPVIAEKSETDQIASVIKGGSLWVIVVSFFGFGILLSLTPCVFPMIPIISSVILAQGKGMGAKKAFFLSLVYVLSMAVAYTIAGILAGLFGANLQAAFQTPWVITSFALIFVLLALSMFDVYELQIPNFIQSRLSKMGSQRGGVIGIAIMGFLSALIVGPCVAAPLAGALIYIGQTGDALLGGVALFSLSIGMGIPLLIVGTTSGRFMPKPGMWMDIIKAVFGVMLLGIAIWMIGRVLDENTTLLLWGGLAIFVAINMNALEPLGAHPSWSSRANVKALGFMILLYGVSLLIGGMAGAKNVLHPLDPFIAQAQAAPIKLEHKKFEKITSIEELNAILAESKGKKVMVDFYADWCTACKELEEKTFSDESVKTAMDQYILVQVDLTANDEAARTISSKFGIFGPPAILFFDENGTRKKDADIVGFKEPQEFIKHLGK
ncbi:MAG: protein-disulfide reductase [Sulfuricurvum sp. PD_MW2]|uniref:protein-disulfide reductase DsbD n=1 Tax=Sulfuricurvum sp. PD_MW2 TaxID=2027917 RepID=UPI000C064DF2|nr:protein-disulfide reductase DsbD [Sulfuricurvum sp. PD_MW2]PHM17577.1 MAG: protein-disulfide reductase [Sulfuricurvum sp. PD_MW2]